MNYDVFICIWSMFKPLVDILKTTERHFAKRFLDVLGSYWPIISVASALGPLGRGALVTGRWRQWQELQDLVNWIDSRRVCHHLSPKETLGPKQFSRQFRTISMRINYIYIIIMIFGVIFFVGVVTSPSASKCVQCSPTCLPACLREIHSKNVINACL